MIMAWAAGAPESGLGSCAGQRCRRDNPDRTGAWGGAAGGESPSKRHWRITGGTGRGGLTGNSLGARNHPQQQVRGVLRAR